MLDELPNDFVSIVNRLVAGPKFLQGGARGVEQDWLQRCALVEAFRLYESPAEDVDDTTQESPEENLEEAIQRLAELQEADFAMRAGQALRFLHQGRVFDFDEGDPKHPVSTATPAEDSQPLAALMRAYVSTVIAAHAVHTNNTDQFVQHANTGLHCFSLVRPISPGPIRMRLSFSPIPGNLPEHRRFLFEAAAAGDLKLDHINESGWLTFDHLLGHLCGFEVALVRSQQVMMLLCRRNADGTLQETGEAVPLEIGLVPASLPGCFLDGVRCGAFVMDAGMRDGLQQAFACNWHELIHRPDGSFHAVLLRPCFPGPVVRFQGGSAGLLAACAIRAVIRDVPLNRDATVTAQILASPNTDLGLTADPVSDASILSKLRAAHAVKPPLTHVVMESEQAQRFAVRPDVQQLKLRLRGVNTLNETYGYLTENWRLEGVLREYGEKVAQRWDAARNDHADPDKLKHYIEPHYSLLKEGDKPQDSSSISRSGDDEPQEGASRYEPVLRKAPAAEALSENELAAAEAIALLRDHPRLCLSEDAGSGKSIATRRLEAFLSSGAADEHLFDGGPCLAVRWEPRVQRWPSRFDEDGLVTALADAMKSVFGRQDEDGTIGEAARWALRQQRVVLILDALDQVDSADSIASLKESLHSGPLRHARVVITSREFAVADYWPLFEETGKWRFGRIDPFDRTQQEAYLEDLYEGDFEAQFPDYETVRDLLQVPVVLAMIRELADDARRFPEFRTRGDLYLKVDMHFMTRAARKLGIAPDGGRRLRWREILAAIACEMLSQSIVNYAVKGDGAVKAIRDAASARCAQPITPEEWEEIIRVSSFTERCIMDNLTSDYVCWKHRGMMEFYGGVHLACNSQGTWVEGDPDDPSTAIRCGDAQVHEHSNDSNWYWPWRFAAEMNEEVWREKPQTLIASLSALFERPVTGVRPTELMYRSWDVLERLPAGRVVLRTFHDDFLGLTRTLGSHRAVARQLLPGGKRKQPRAPGGNIIFRLLDWVLDLLRPGMPGFVPCPAGRFMMGSADNDDQAYSDERPQHEVRVGALLLQSTPVTRAQYRLFDAHHEQLYQDSFQRFAPEDECPAIYVSWYDAWVFARWVGARLPSEAEWEYACRAGSVSRYYFGDAVESLGEYAWYNQNSDGRTHPVGRKKPNAWGLYDMHGNVWEWCADWFDERYYSQSIDNPVDDPPGPMTGSYRVVRGGGWGNFAGDCRSAYRYRFTPSYRNDYLGFRLAFSSVDQSDQ